MGADFAHVVGYVGPVSDYYIEQTGDTDPVLQIPDFQVGRYNVEARMEAELRGAPAPSASRSTPPDARCASLTATRRRRFGRAADHRRGSAELRRGAPVRRKRGRRGDGLHQTAKSSRWPPRRPSIRTFSCAASARRNGQALNEDPYRPLANKATQGLYPPGSTYKMIVALAALEAGRDRHRGADQLHRPYRAWRGAGSTAGSARATAASD
jgi:penicillin-binding protein 2